MKRIVLIILPFFLLIVSLFLFIPGANAAQCYMASAYVGYVCDARPAQHTFVVPKERPDSIIPNFTFSWIEDHAPLYSGPSFDSAMIGDAGTGFIYQSIADAATDAEGNRWFKVLGGWTLAGNVNIVEGTPFAGMEVHARPQRPFGWMLDTWILRDEPAGSLPPQEERVTLKRYDFVQIYGATRAADGLLWYDIGGGRWVKENYLGIVDYAERPDGIEPHEYWVAVDLTEQVFAAYEGDRMVYASLVSSGLDRWPTREGLFTVWDRHMIAPMSGGEVGDDFYNIEHVPHPMYFDDGISLHGAYWHNAFGLKKSHGCVNMPPKDAEWVYFWSAAAPGDLRVWVYSNAEEHILQKFNGGLLASSPAVPFAD